MEIPFGRQILFILLLATTPEYREVSANKPSNAEQSEGYDRSHYFGGDVLVPHAIPHSIKRIMDCM